MFFHTVVVIGAGKVARGCLSTLIKTDRRKQFNQLVFIENGSILGTNMAQWCENNDISFILPSSSKSITTWFAQKKDNTLVISAANYYIFPVSIVSKNNIFIVNYHDALLPAYPVRNAITWAIFRGENMTGVTWHMVNAGIDTGDVIAQRTINIDDDTKAYELLQKSFYEACICFESFVDDLLLWRIHASKQQSMKNRKVYLSSEVPNNGIVDLSWQSSEIYRLLRSLDYSGLNIMPPPKVYINEQERTVVQYSKISKDKSNDVISALMPRRNDFLLLNLSVDYNLLIKLK